MSLVSQIRKLWRRFSFRDPVLERQFHAEYLLSSRYLFVGTALIFSFISVITLVTLFNKRRNPEVGMTWARVLLGVPVVCSIAPLLVSAVAPLWQRYFVRLHVHIVVSLALGMSAYTSVIPSLEGRPFSQIWPILTAIVPVMLLVSVRLVVVFQAIHAAFAVAFFGVFVPNDAWGRAASRKFGRGDWRFLLVAVFQGVVSVIIAVAVCARVELTSRRLFMERVNALKDAEAVRELKLRGQGLLRAVLPEEVARRIESTGQVAYAEKAHEVGVLALRFSKPYLQRFKAAQGTKVRTNVRLEFERMCAEVSTLDSLLASACTQRDAQGAPGLCVEKICVIDGMYIAASNVAVPPKSAIDPGQRFIALARFAAAALGAIPGARAGLHVGPCASGVLGTSRVAFDIFGKTLFRAVSLCEQGTGDLIYCSGPAQRAMPGSGVKWLAPLSIKISDREEVEAGKEIFAHPVQSLTEAGLSGGSPSLGRSSLQPQPINLEPVSPHSEAVGVMGRSIYRDETVRLSESASAAQKSRRSSFGDGDGDDGSKDGLLLPGVPEVDVTLTSPGKEGPAASLTRPTPPRAAELKGAESAEANHATLFFKDPALEAAMRASAPPLLGAVTAALGAVVFFLALVVELTDTSHTKWTGVLIAFLAFAGFVFVSFWAKLPSRRSPDVLVVISIAMFLGALVLSACLLLPASPWIVYRVATAFLFMTLVACAGPTLFPIAATILFILSSALALFFFTKKHHYSTLISSTSFPLLWSFVVLGSSILCYFGDRDTRRSFLLTRHCHVTVGVIRSELNEIKSIGKSCLPASVVSRYFESRHAGASAASAASAAASTAAMVTTTTSDPGSLEGTSPSQNDPTRGWSAGNRGITDLDKALSAPPIELPEWAVLSCCLAGFAALVDTLDQVDLVLLLRHFFLVVEGAAAAEGCEVIRTFGGNVLVSPKIEGGEPDTPGSRVSRVIRVGKTIIRGTSGLKALLPATCPLITEAKVGVAAGPCVGGMVGKVKSFFDLFGHAPAKAISLAASAAPGAIEVGPVAKSLIAKAFDLNQEFI
jgi:class 3 adenylate cyclase